MPTRRPEGTSVAICGPAERPGEVELDPGITDGGRVSIEQHKHVILSGVGDLNRRR